MRTLRVWLLPALLLAAIAPLAYVSSAQAEDKAETKKIVFLAGRRSHGYGAHEHYAGCMILADSLKKNMGYDTVVYKYDWPESDDAFDGADCIVMYADGGGGHPALRHLDQVDALAKKGVGIACIHYAVEVPKDPGGKYFLDWIGGYFETHWSVNPHWLAEFKELPDHPVANGVKPFKSQDEWYYNMRFREDMKGVTPILSAVPPESTLSRPDGAHSGNPHVRKMVGQPQHVAWVSENENDGRGFGCTGGHFHWNWGQDDFRKTVLNAIVWCADGEVPENGVGGEKVTVEDLRKNQDFDEPGNLNLDKIKEEYHLQGSTSGGKIRATTVSQTKAAKSPKPLAKTGVVSAATKGHREAIEADVSGKKMLYLVAADGGDGYGCDWAAWINPRLITDKGEVSLTELKWKSASADFGSAQINKNCQGQPLRVNGQEIETGIGTHANSVIAYELPAGAKKFVAEGGLDEGGTRQGCGSTIQFLVYDEKPAVLPTADGDSTRTPEVALSMLDVHKDLDATLFAAEPMLLSPSNIDIDHLGRVWVCEIVNYRGHNGERPEGDRILVLEDTDGDGAADKETVFYQGRDIDSPHGICVLATPDFKGTKVIVSAGDKVQVFTDKDGDAKADSQETLFSGISGKQHDHGIHAFVFGPDGKLYFNFGNAGGQIRDKDGKPIVDLAGNEINSSRKPYQEGMVFRCDLDGSNVETLGWNFRNNWMVTVDSFGRMWQSDNDDDGNKGVRINYVMPFGNYGYKDEFTGAGWKASRTNMSEEIPLRHWHLNDPGVVPNLLQTGAGSPTGITIYEGDLLPKTFQGQIIHCDAGPNVCRAYPVEVDGAGFTATVENILVGTRDRWYRPSDVSVAPDGSLIIADWYDPGVGGHGMKDMNRGRLFRIVPAGHDGKYTVPKFDFSTLDGALTALKNPNYAVRYVAFQAIADMEGEKVDAALTKMATSDDNPVYRARAIWLLAYRADEPTAAVRIAAADKDERIRGMAVEIARQSGNEEMLTGVAERLAGDTSPAVRRDVAVGIRFLKGEKATDIWAKLATQYPAGDRWYLEALGIGAGLHWDECLAAYLDEVGDKWNTPAGRDIVWRSRAKKTPELLAEIVTSGDVKAEDQPRYMRAFDFLSGPEKEAALLKILSQ